MILFHAGTSHEYNLAHLSIVFQPLPWGRPHGSLRSLRVRGFPLTPAEGEFVGISMKMALRDVVKRPVYAALDGEKNDGSHIAMHGAANVFSVGMTYRFMGLKSFDDCPQ